MGKGMAYTPRRQKATLCVFGLGTALLAAVVLIPTGNWAAINYNSTATTITATITTGAPPANLSTSTPDRSHAHPLDSLAVVRRATARMNDRKACPWEKMEAWANMSRRASETTDVDDFVFFLHNRDGPGYGVTLAIEVAAIMIGMLTDRPVRSIPKTAHAEKEGFNARGELIGSSVLGDWFQSSNFVMEHKDVDDPDGEHRRLGVMLTIPGSAQEDILVPEVRFGVMKSLTEDYGWTVQHRKVLRPFSVASMLKKTPGPVVITSGVIESDGMPFIYDFLISENNTSPSERSFAKDLGARMSDFAAPQCVLRLLLNQPSKGVKDLVFDALKGIGESDVLVSIHSRRGDYVMGQECSSCVNDGDPESHNGEERVTMENGKLAMLQVKKSIVDPITSQGRKVVVFLASDTIGMVSVAKRVFDDVRHIPGKPMHTSQMSGDSDRRTAAAFWGLALGDVCLRTMSTFGGMAIEMSGCLDFSTASTSETLSGSELADGLSVSDVRKLLSSIP
mmetsp:Transcript_3145/g.6031  ORF Transcript_3145/g.6031 Transcript_3145/m.6031 type:complete len:507 (+) Transcript_3145:86-1606(+)